MSPDDGGGKGDYENVSDRHSPNSHMNIKEGGGKAQSDQQDIIIANLKVFFVEFLIWSALPYQTAIKDPIQ